MADCALLKRLLKRMLKTSIVFIGIVDRGTRWHQAMGVPAPTLPYTFLTESPLSSQWAGMKRKRPAPNILQRSAAKNQKSAPGKPQRKHPSTSTAPAAPTPPASWRCASVVDQQASTAVERMLRAKATGDGGCALKTLTLAAGNQAKAATHAVTCETLKRTRAFRVLNPDTTVLMACHPQTCPCWKPCWTLPTSGAQPLGYAQWHCNTYDHTMHAQLSHAAACVLVYEVLFGKVCVGVPVPPCATQPSATPPNPTIPGAPS